MRAVLKVTDLHSASFKELHVALTSCYWQRRLVTISDTFSQTEATLV